MDKRIKKIIQVSVLAILLFSNGLVFAQANEYIPLAPLPGTNTNCVQANGCGTNLSTYLPGIFNLAIGVGAIAAFVLLTMYGFEYMLTDSIGTKLGAKERLTNVAWGLGLVIFAYVILNTINPKLLSGNLNLQTPQITAPAGVVASGDEAAMRKALGPKIQVSGNTEVLGLTQNTVAGVQTLQQMCGCTLDITGGSETTSHTSGGSHGAGTGVDLAVNPSLNKTFTGNTNTPPAHSCQRTTVNVGGRQATALFETQGDTCGGQVPSSGTHWHVTFQ